MSDCLDRLEIDCLRMNFVCVVFILCVINVDSEYVTVKLTNERISTMMLSTYGFLKDADFKMNLSITFSEDLSSNQSIPIRLRFDKSSSGGRMDYLGDGSCTFDPEELQKENLKKKLPSEEQNVPRSLLIFDKNRLLKVLHYRFSGLRLFSNELMYHPINGSLTNTTDSKNSDQQKLIQVASLPYNVSPDRRTLKTSLYFRIETNEQNGLYEFYLHKCDSGPAIESGQIDIIEKNANSYLSAGEMNLPTMYTIMACVTFFTSFFWVHILWKNKGKVFKIHYLMAVFMFVKALSISFHAVDYYFIGRDGKQEAWAVIFYVLHLLKGTLLFICLLLIGTGWAFIKYVLTDREKKLFMVVIPIQVIANIAYMIHEESGFQAYTPLTWTELMFIFDILCFGIILMSVSWSVRHLQEASATDGKAAISLVKLKLFQHFYVMVILYLYFRRVLVYLLQITLPFHYTWIHQLFYEIVSLIFFVITGYKFRPGCDNPYLSVSTEDDEEVESQPLTKSGLTETLTKVNQQLRHESDDDETVVLLQRNKTSFV